MDQSKLEVVSSFWRETRKTFARPYGCGKTSTPQWRIQTWAKVGGLLDLPLPSAILFLPKIRRVEPPGPSPRSATAPDWMRKSREFSKQLVQRSWCKTNCFSTLEWKALYIQSLYITAEILTGVSGVCFRERGIPFQSFAKVSKH